MSTKFGKYILVLPILSLLVACAGLSPLEAQNTDSKKIAQNAKTYSDHNNLANYYDNLTQEMVAKVEEQKESLEHYTNHSNTYGRRGQDFQSHTMANIRHYEQAAASATKQAGIHREIAAKLLQRDKYAEPTETPEQENSRNIKAKLNSNSGDLN
ncbi:MAG: hypothetical protein H0X02_13145 [Nitrosomonas sp.]|nr:hypothetical protein [Nitrosomonas sp.]